MLRLAIDSRRIALSLSFLGLMALTTPGCVTITTTPAQGCMSDGDCEPGYTCFTSEVGGFCDRDEDGNGVADMVDLGFTPGAACDSDDCLPVEGVTAAGCTDGTDCLSGHCYQGSCVTGEDGTPCDEADQCTTNYCSSQGLCGKSEDGAVCPSSADCLSGVCHTNGTCVPGDAGDSCTQDSDCQAPITCEGPSDATEGLSCSGLTLGESCSEADTDANTNDCVEGFCFAYVCQAGVNGESCSAADGDKDCAHRCIDGSCSDGLHGQACDETEDCVSTIEAPLRCLAGGCITPGEIALGDSCNDSIDCASGYCQGVCQTGETGDPCDADDDCQYACLDGACTEGQAGDPCSESVPCQNEDTLLCVFGACLVPGSAGDGDPCSDADHCGSGYCDTAGNGCTSGANGEPCGAPTDCESSYCQAGVCQGGVTGDPCDDDQVCLYACLVDTCTEGKEDEPCSAEVECQSSGDPELTCSFGVCIPVGSKDVGDPCEGVVDCQSGYCYMPDSTCTSGGVGSACEGPAGCETGFCHSNLCQAGANGDPCDTDAVCQLGCIDGACTESQLGQACDVLHPCAADAATSLTCLFGSCVLSGQQELGDGCLANADCASTFCDNIGQVCTTGEPGAPCATDEGCSDAICYASLCQHGHNGDPCGDSSDCQTACLAGQCTDGEVGQTCDQSSPCQPVDGEESLCLLGICTLDGTQGVGDGCLEHSHCLTNYCDTNAQLCTTGANGASCSDPAGCASSNCYQFICQAGVDGDECATPEHCQAGCVAGTCSDGLLAQACDDTAPCSVTSNLPLSCVGGVCTIEGGNELGAICSTAAQCASGICHSLDGVCTDGALGEGCAGPADCASGFCVEAHCSAGETGDPCLEPSDCLYGCISGACTEGAIGDACSELLPCIPDADSLLMCLFNECVVDGGQPDGSPCADGGDCLSSYCNTVANVCTSGGSGDGCGTNDDCATGICYEAKCQAGQNGEPCTNAEHCLYGCLAESCSEGLVGQACSDDLPCINEVTSELACLLGTCIVAGAQPLGAVCIGGDDCLSSYCDSAAGICTNGSSGVGCGLDLDCMSSICHLGACQSGVNSEPCDDGTDCLYACLDGACTDGQLGQACSDTIACATDAPSELTCLLGTCVVEGGQPEGAACSTASNCLSGYCHSQEQVCIAGSDGSPCGAPQDCASGACYLGTCQAGTNGDPCSTDADCLHGCVDGACTEGQEGQSCSDAVVCAADSPDSLTCVFAICVVEGEQAEGDPCVSGDNCVSSYCHSLDHICTTGANGSGCGVPQDCASGCCHLGVCQAGVNGDPCDANDDCLHGCVDETCTEGQPGQTCSDIVPCATDSPDSLTCLFGLCIVEGNQSLGDPCMGGTNCLSGYCHTVEQICTTGDNGAACGATQDCASGFCHLDTCQAGVNGDPCDANDDCLYQCLDGICTEGLIGQHCLSPATPDNANDCLEGYCYAGLCQSGASGQPCNETNSNTPAVQDNDCAYRCLDNICTDGQQGQPCAGDVPCLDSEAGLLACIAGLCEPSCTSTADCTDGDEEAPQYCQVGSEGVGFCTNGGVHVPCAGNNHCGPGLTCLGQASTTSWLSASPDNRCTDNQVGSPCLPSGSGSTCEGGAVCVGDQTPTSDTVAGVCQQPHFGSPCQVVLENTSDCSSAKSDHAIGRSDCGDGLWTPTGDYQGGAWDSDEPDPLGWKRRLVCIPSSHCDLLDAENPTCEGTCGFAPPGAGCLSFDPDATASCGTGSYFTGTTPIAFGCEEGLFCVDGTCTLGAVGDPCSGNECLSGLKCFGGACAADSCTPDCEGKTCGDDGCGGHCGTCGAGQTCLNDPDGCDDEGSAHAAPNCCTADIVVTEGSYPSEVSWELRDGTNTTVLYSGVVTNSTSVTLMLGTNYVFRMKDAFGDGWNSAQYTVSMSGTTTASGTFTSGYSSDDTFTTPSGCNGGAVACGDAEDEATAAEEPCFTCTDAVVLALEGDSHADSETTVEVQDLGGGNGWGPYFGPESSTGVYPLPYESTGAENLLLTLTDSDDDGGLEAWVYVCGALVEEVTPKSSWASKFMVSLSTPSDCGCAPHCDLQFASYCAGLPPLPTSNLPTELNDSTLASQDRFSLDGIGCPGIAEPLGASSPDVAYSFTPGATGVYSISVEADFEAVVAVTKTCADVNAECVGAAVSSASITSMLVADQAYTVIVDGAPNSSNVSGAFTLSVSAPCCGDGCGECDPGYACNGTLCECVPDCSGKECGDDGCGGSCGTCDDGNGCTTDYCGASNLCEVIPDVGEPCDDDDICTLDDACNFSGSCTGTPKDCDDGVACTEDECDASGTCQNTPLDSSCNDGLWCTDDACDADSGCINDQENNTCIFGGSCYGYQHTHPYNECQWCSSTNSWGSIPHAIPCTKQCYPQWPVCSGGQCICD